MTLDTLKRQLSYKPPNATAPSLISADGAVLASTSFRVIIERHAHSTSVMTVVLPNHRLSAKFP